MVNHVTSRRRDLEDKSQIKPLTKLVEEGKFKLLGHVLRRDRQNPVSKLRFPQVLHTKKTEHRKRGRAPQFLTTNTMRKARDLMKTHDAMQPQVPFG